MKPHKMTQMQLKCIAIDDEPLALELIKQYALSVPELQFGANL
jgi:hypothetical protein